VNCHYLGGRGTVRLTTNYFQGACLTPIVCRQFIGAGISTDKIKDQTDNRIGIEGPDRGADHQADLGEYRNGWHTNIVIALLVIVAVYLSYRNGLDLFAKLKDLFVWG